MIGEINAVITPIFKKRDRREPKNYGGISINTCYKIYSKILDMKPRKYSEVFMTETQSGFRKGRSCTDPAFYLKLLIEKRREFVCALERNGRHFWVTVISCTDGGTCWRSF
jgi:hypothetical protein